MPRPHAALLALPLAVALAPAQPKDDPLERFTYRLTTTPAAAPTPALKFQFRTSAAERLSGNAALDYYRAALLMPEWPREPEKGEKLRADQDRWLEAKLDAFPDAEVTAFLKPFDAGFAALDAAARREVVDWRQGVKLEHDGMDGYLREIQKFREVSYLNRFRVRRDLARNDFDRAAVAVRSGFRLGQAVAEGPTLLQMLVGVAVCHSGWGDAVAFVGRPGSPNLYWALASLPRPLVDPRPALEGEEEFNVRGYRAQGPFTKADEHAFRAFMHDVRRAFPLPYQKAIAELDDIAARERERSKARGEPAEKGYAAVVPFMRKCYHVHAQLDRRMAGLMAVEAVRLHTAGAKGAPPAALADIIAVAVPPDPFTGRPFVYAARADGFTLAAPPPAGEDWNSINDVRFVITFRR